jgi:regulator of protease activity HflC (stomatin/prohibitin superfamily)
MNSADISALARHLFEAQGAKAIAEAAQKAASFQKAGEVEQAKFWRRVQAVLNEMRGPKES